MFNGVETISFWTRCSVLEESFHVLLDLILIPDIGGCGDATPRLWLGVLREGRLCPACTLQDFCPALSEHVL